MKADSFNPALLGVAVEPGQQVPAYLQLYEQIRELILSGRLAPGDRLPSTRRFASELGLSRTTLVSAYDQLQSEGYLETRRGSGVFVARFSPEHLLLVSSGAPQKSAGSKFSQAHHKARPFEIRATSPADFPAEDWARLLQKSWRSASGGLFRPDDVAGDPDLRGAVAEHLHAWRGIAVEADQVIVTSGSGEAVELLLSVLVEAGDRVWLENPGYLPMRRLVRGAGLEPVFLPVDDEGLSVAAGERRAPDARLAIATPPRQFPLGMTMSLPRRLALLNWARKNEAWILEDDYDSEFRYEGRPLAALMSMDETERVIYLGSFSKVMFKGLRLGYLVVPQPLRDACIGVLEKWGPQASTVAQPALADFMRSGQFASHIRRMRRLYARRRACILQALEAECAGLVTVEPANSGMHVVVSLASEALRTLGDAKAAAVLGEAGIVAEPLSGFHAPDDAEAPVRQGLLLGFSGFTEEKLAGAVAEMARHLRTCAP
ncbi:MAG: PLP-dependent aminotransferase family protein [Pseudomonadota bacterium]